MPPCMLEREGRMGDRRRHRDGEEGRVLIMGDRREERGRERERMPAFHAIIFQDRGGK